MAENTYLISDSDVAQVHVAAAPTVLQGTALENKQVFDKYSDMIRNKFNTFVTHAEKDFASQTGSIKAAAQAIYPVGSVIRNTSGTDPNSYLGFGIWIELGDMKTVMARQSGDKKTVTVHVFERTE